MKRLAEIVSAQAIAQQEKPDYDDDQLDDVAEQTQGLAITGADSSGNYIHQGG